MEIYAQAPNRTATILHDFGPNKGDSLKIYDGSAGWIAAPNKPIPLMPMTGGNLEGAKLEAIFFFPRSEEHTSELQSRLHLVCRLLLEKKKKHSKGTRT